MGREDEEMKVRESDVCLHGKVSNREGEKVRFIACKTKKNTRKKSKGYQILITHIVKYKILIDSWKHSTEVQIRQRISD